MARVKPERRRPIDLAITATIIALVAVAGLIAWLVSPVRGTTSVQAQSTPPEVEQPAAVPDAFAPRWQATSDATVVPAIADSVVVTGDGGTTYATAVYATILAMPYHYIPLYQR